MSELAPRILKHGVGDRQFVSTLYYGQQNVETLRSMAPGSVQCVITSPPYWGLRDYGTAAWEGGDPTCEHGIRTWDGPKQTQGAQSGHASKADTIRPTDCVCGARRTDFQIGLEETPEAYVASMVGVFREVWRVLRDDGTLWLNLGDSYASQGGRSEQGSTSQRLGRSNVGAQTKSAGTKPPPGLKAKDLVGIPWRVALALQADGWYLRSDIIWAKGNPMPESVTDRPTRSHEYLFLLTKNSRYFYDADAIQEPQVFGDSDRQKKRRPEMWREQRDAHKGLKVWETDSLKTDGWPCGSPSDGYRNKRSVWQVNPKPYKGAHFATMPPKLIEPCLRAGTSEKGCCPFCGAPWEREVETSGGRDWRQDKMVDVGIPGAVSGDGSNKRGRMKGNLRDTKTRMIKGWAPTCNCDPHDPVPCVVLDPFSGSGTTGYVANREGRNFVGLDLNPEYLPLAEERITGMPPLAAPDPVSLVDILFGASDE